MWIYSKSLIKGLIRKSIKNGIKSKSMKRNIDRMELQKATSFLQHCFWDQYTEPVVSGCVDRMDFAGSWARGEDEVHDIEMMLQPKPESVDMFGDPIGRDPHFVDVFYNGSFEILKGDPSKARYVQALLIDKEIVSAPIQIDFFMPTPADYYIRTGPAKYTHEVIALAWAKAGWCGGPDGLRLRKECKKTPSGWVCNTTNPTLPPVWESEQEFFEWLGIEWVHPTKRGK